MLSINFPNPLEYPWRVHSIRTINQPGAPANSCRPTCLVIVVFILFQADQFAYIVPVFCYWTMAFAREPDWSFVTTRDWLHIEWNIYS